MLFSLHFHCSSAGGWGEFGSISSLRRKPNPSRRVTCRLLSGPFEQAQALVRFVAVRIVSARACGQGTQARRISEYRKLEGFLHGPAGSSRLMGSVTSMTSLLREERKRPRTGRSWAGALTPPATGGRRRSAQDLAASEEAPRWDADLPARAPRPAAAA